MAKFREWVPLTLESELGKACVFFGSYSNPNSNDFDNYNMKVTTKAKDALDSLARENDHWHPILQKFLGGSRFKVIVEYNENTYCELKVKNKEHIFELVGVKESVKLPKRVTQPKNENKKVISLSFNAESKETSSLIKEKTPRILENGVALFSAKGMEEIKMRAYDPGLKNSLVEVDTTENENFINKEVRDNLERAFTQVSKISKKSGKKNSDLHSIPSNKINTLFEQLERNKCEFEMSEVVRRRIIEFIRLDGDNEVYFERLLEIINRALNESKGGHFYMTVHELQDIFSKHDSSLTGKLTLKDVSKLLHTINVILEPEKIAKFFKTFDADVDHNINFEDFLTLCQSLFKERNGYVVANRADEARFNQTRIVIDALREKLERHYLKISHYKNEYLNLEEQLEVMNSINSHSSLQSEISKVREEKRGLLELKEEMEKQQKMWLRNLKELKMKETDDIQEKIDLIEQQHLSAEQALKFCKSVYERDFSDAKAEVMEVMQSLTAMRDFAEKTVLRTAEDCSNSRKLASSAKSRLIKSKEGRAGTVYSQNVYDASTASLHFLKAKTSALEEWLISRTRFTQKDREKYIQRVEAAKAKREEYDENKALLEGELMTTKRKMETQSQLSTAAEDLNVNLRKKLSDAGNSKVMEDTMATSLQKKLRKIQEEISDLQMKKLKVARSLYPKQHELQQQRHAISLLQVELGELKILLEDVNAAIDTDATTNENMKGIKQ
eukprot:g1802.t1